MRPGFPAPVVGILFVASIAVSGAAAEPSLRFGMRADAPPFSERVPESPTDADFDAAYRGFSVLLCSRIANNLQDQMPDLRIDHVAVTAQTRFPSEQHAAEEWDLLCDPTSITQARLDWCSFSFPFFVTGIAYAVRDPALRTADLGGKPAALVGETTADSVLEADWQRRYGAPPEFRESEDYAEAVQALKSGVVEAVFGDQVLLQQALEDAGMAQDTALSTDVLSIELYGLCVAPERPSLLAAVNATLAQLYRSGEIYDLLGASFDGRGANRLLSNLYRLYSVPEK